MASCCSLAGAICWWQIHDTAETTENQRLPPAEVGAVRPEPARPVSGVLFFQQPVVTCRVGALCVCLRVCALHLCRLCRNPLNVSSSQSKSWGEPAWPAEFRWVLLVLLIHAVVCVLSVKSQCVFLHTRTHTRVVVDGSANVRSSV